MVRLKSCEACLSSYPAVTAHDADDDDDDDADDDDDDDDDDDGCEWFERDLWFHGEAMVILLDCRSCFSTSSRRTAACGRAAAVRAVAGWTRCIGSS